MILTKGDKDDDYRRPSLGQAADVLSDALSEDTTLPFSCITSVAAEVGKGARSLPTVIKEGMKWEEKKKLQVKINTSGPTFVIAIAPKSSHPLAKMMITAICIVLNKTVGFDKMKPKVKQDTIVEILENFRKVKLAAALTSARLASNVLPFNTFPEGVWRKIVDMGLVVVKEEKKANSSVESTKKRKTETKSSKKRKAETKSETEPTTKRRSSRRRSS